MSTSLISPANVSVADLAAVFAKRHREGLEAIDQFDRYQSLAGALQVRARENNFDLRFQPPRRFPGNSVVVIAHDDFLTFGMLSSTFHAQWAHSRGNFTGAGNDLRYTPSITFDTFPFTEGLAPDKPYKPDNVNAQRIVGAAANLDALRKGWLNPPEL